MITYSNGKKYNNASFIELLRKEISEKFDEESLQFFKFIKEVYTEDYEWLKNTYTVQDAKEIIKTADYWADQWAISETEKILSCKIIIYNQSKRKILCTGNSDEHLNNYIILYYTGNNHYNLISINNETLFRIDTLPQLIRDKYIERCRSNH